MWCVSCRWNTVKSKAGSHHNDAIGCLLPTIPLSMFWTLHRVWFLAPTHMSHVVLPGIFLEYRNCQNCFSNPENYYFVLRQISAVIPSIPTLWHCVKVVKNCAQICIVSTTTPITSYFMDVWLLYGGCSICRHFETVLERLKVFFSSPTLMSSFTAFQSCTWHTSSLSRSWSRVSVTGQLTNRLVKCSTHL